MIQILIPSFMRISSVHMENLQIMMICFNTLLQWFILSFERTWELVIHMQDLNCMDLENVINMNSLAPCEMLLDVGFKPFI